MSGYHNVKRSLLKLEKVYGENLHNQFCGLSGVKKVWMVMGMNIYLLVLLTLIEYHKLLHLFNRMTIFQLYLMVVLKTIIGLMIQRE